MPVKAILGITAKMYLGTSHIASLQNISKNHQSNKRYEERYH